MYEMQIKIAGEWVSIKASHESEPYRYETYEEAERMLRICYPNPEIPFENKRIKKV